MTEKRRFPAALALSVGRELCDVLRPLCEPSRILICGSLRRRKESVGDVEIVFVPRMRVVSEERLDLFGEVETPEVITGATHPMLDHLVESRVLAKRAKVDGTFTWGKFNRLAVHAETGVPVDFFACTEEAWWNIVVCRTGGPLTNIQICQGAILRRWYWEPSPVAAGFVRNKGLLWERHPVASEREVFEFAGVEFAEPWERA